MTNDDLTATTVSFQGAHGDTVGAYLVGLKSGGPLPAVIVVHGATGASDETKEHAQRLARAGFLVALPDLYSRVESPDLSSLEAAMRILSTLADDQAADDLEGCATFLKGHARCNGRVGAIGIGGRYAYVFASQSDKPDAVVVCYGPLMGAEIDTPELRPRTPIQMVPDFSCPVLGIFGDEDQNPSPEHVRQFEELLQRTGKSYEFHSYPNAAHSFLDVGRRNYAPEAAESAWQDIIAWLHRQVG